MDLQERIARALCSKANLPENIIRQGRPMWMDFLGEAKAVLDALGEPLAWGYWLKGPGRRGNSLLRVSTSRDEAEAVRENGVDVFPLIGAKERPK